MRGKVCLFNLCELHYRITPAYAGKRQPSPVCYMQCEDHPRLCGEKTHPLEPQVLRQGSPPPMRGKGSNYIVGLQGERITPAYAGKSFSISFHLNTFLGSPPPMRGKVTEIKTETQATRITPAYAGKS